MALFDDLKGTSNPRFQISKGGVQLANLTQGLRVRNAADTADSPITASIVNVSGLDLLLNSDAAGAGADWLYTLRVPATGMTGPVIFQFPTTDGTAGQILSTDGNGVTDWISVGSTADKLSVNETALLFSSGATTAAFTLPAFALNRLVEVDILVPFSGGTGPSLSVGIAGNVSKYMASNQVDLTSPAGDSWRTHPRLAAQPTPENIILTYAANGATAGSAQVIISYVVPA
jgi:hypothetical protein